MMNVETIVAQISGAESITGKIELEGLKGDKGTTFIPSVNENGDLSWSNDGGLENPQTVNIRGPRGERGIQGERGDKGEIGPQGPIGQTGPQGETGPQGPKGESGMPGPSNLLTIGTVTKGDTAGATITGISPNQILNLVLPKGDKGDKGDKGETGPQGPTGPAGAEGEVLQQIYIGETEPTEENVDIWIDPSGDSVMVPEKTSDLINDSNFVNEDYVTNAISTAIGSALGGSY